MMPSRYDHTSYIYRPRAFALSLGSMLADQFGIRGGEVQVDARIADLHASNRRGSQTIFHGPVVYEQDKFARYTSPRNEFEAFLGKIFIKESASKSSGNIDSLSGRRMNRPKITWISGYRWQCGRPCCR